MSGITVLAEPSTSAIVDHAVRKTLKKSRPAGSKQKSKPPLGRLLASSDKDIREAAVERLLDFLAGTDDNNEEELQKEQQEQEQDGQLPTTREDWNSIKLPKAFRQEQMLVLWQGCFYCMYMCDKPMPQHQLANQLATPLLSLLENKQLSSQAKRNKAAVTYLSAFWSTMTKEWPNVDKHRTDKFYTLMRRMLCCTFQMMAKSQWNTILMQEVFDILTRLGGPLHLQDNQTSVSMAYHIIDIYLDELDRALASCNPETAEGSEDAIRVPAPLVAILEPLMVQLSVAINKTAIMRITENIFDPLLDAIGKNADAEDESEPPAKRRKGDDAVSKEEEQYGNILADQPSDIRNLILRCIFDQGAKPQTEGTNRRRLYMYASGKGFDGGA